MAIVFPQLFCQKGDSLKSIKDIHLDDVDILTGDIFLVSDIVGYRFDLKSINDNSTLSFLNSQLNEYFVVFEVADRKNKSIEGEIVKVKTRKTYFLNDQKILDQGSELFLFTRDLEDSHITLYGHNTEPVIRFSKEEFKEYIVF